MPYNSNFKDIQFVLSGLWGCVCAYFEGTGKFIIAFALSFILDLCAGLKVCDYKITTLSFWKNIKKILFNGFLILGILLLLHQIYILMIDSNPALLLTKISIGVASFFYIKNAINNLSTAYPDIVLLKFLVILLTMKFKQLLPKDISKAVDKAEYEQKKQTKKKNKNEE